MLDKLMKLKEMKKGSGEMRPVEKNAKMSVLKDLIGEAGNEMVGGMRNLKKHPASEDVNNAPKFMGIEHDDSISPEVADEMGEATMSPEELSEDEMSMDTESLGRKIEALIKLKEDKMSSGSEGN